MKSFFPFIQIRKPRCTASPFTRLEFKPVRVAALIFLFAGGGTVSIARAQSEAPPNGVEAAGAAATKSPAQSAIAPATGPSADQASPPTGLWERSNLLGDMGGVRPLLDSHGITLGLQETSEAYGNFSGGTKKGLAYNGATLFGLGVDTDKAFGLKGGQFNVSALQIHGHGITTANLNATQTVSGMEAVATTRLWELWYQQSFLDGKFDVRAGQQSIDQTFLVTDYGGLFVNATFGWPGLPSADLPAGGPAYPLSSLGVQMRAKVSDAVTVLGGVFDGEPALGTGDPQRENAHGTQLDLHGGALLIGEVQYQINPPAPEGSPQPAGLPGTYKLGFWYNTNRFADQHFGQDGTSLANAPEGGDPAMHRGNFSVYAVADQMVWRPSADSAKSIGVFARAMGAPSNRNLINLMVQGGVVLKAPFKGRDNDSVGLAVSYANFSPGVSALDRDTAAASPGYPVRSAETVIEATYQYQIVPWWQLQADLQYIVRPGGGIPNPNNDGRRIGNEAVAGLRTVVVF
jgi:porin